MTTETLTLTEFLLARIAEDEADWHAVDARQVTELLHGKPLAPRMLAECEAKRRIVAMCIETLATKGGGFPADDSGYVEAHSLAAASLRALAIPYADHPDYDEAWRP